MESWVANGRIQYQDCGSSRVLYNVIIVNGHVLLAGTTFPNRFAHDTSSFTNILHRYDANDNPLTISINTKAQTFPQLLRLTIPIIYTFNIRNVVTKVKWYLRLRKVDNYGTSRTQKIAIRYPIGLFYSISHLSGLKTPGSGKLFSFPWSKSEGTEIGILGG